ELVYQGIRTVAIEPNPDMFQILEAKSATTSLLTAVQATAEDSTLPDASMSLITAGQSFHWFDQRRFREACRRVLRPGGRVALLCTSSRRQDHISQANAVVLRPHVDIFPDLSGSHDESVKVLVAILGLAGCESSEVANNQRINVAEFLR